MGHLHAESLCLDQLLGKLSTCDIGQIRIHICISPQIYLMYQRMVETVTHSSVCIAFTRTYGVSFSAAGFLFMILWPMNGQASGKTENIF